MSPWIVTLDALEPFATSPPQREFDRVAPYLSDPHRRNYEIDLQAEIIANGKNTVICRSNYKTMWWTFREMLAHQTVGGCPLRAGDIIACGTCSGPGDDEHACLTEMTFGGTKEFGLSDGSKRKYLLDNDVVRLTAVARKDGVPSVGFGECTGEVLPAT